MKLTTESDYSRKDGAITATAIKAGAISMAHMRAAMLGQSKPQTPAMRLGSLVHAAILRPQALPGLMAIWEGDRRGGAWKAFAEQNSHLIIVTASEYQDIAKLVRFVRSKPGVARILDSVQTEVIREWNVAACGRGKCRLDGEAPNYWIELKTTSATSRAAYAAQHYRMGYDMQLGWYSIGAGIHKPCKLITVCTGEVPDVVVYHVAPDLIEAGREKAEAIATRYRACEAAGTFPGADEGEEEVLFQPPAWAVSGTAWTVGEEDNQGGMEI